MLSSCCRSLRRVPRTIAQAWEGGFDDEQARSFTATLYSSLRYSTIRSSHEEAFRELTSPYPDLAEPQLLCANQRDTQLFRTSDHGL
ncbi:MAG: hypothetical protein ACRDZ4_06585 [Egibacteraceae bacterium]